MANNTNPPIDYTSKDFRGFRDSMLEYAKTVMPDWDTSSEGDFGVVLVELFAYMADIMSFYGDRISQEAYLPTATQRISVLNICNLLGYVPANGTPATGTVRFKSDDPGPPAIVPAGTQVISEYRPDMDSPIVFETDETLELAGDGGEGVVTVTQGETKTKVLLGTSTGLPGQRFTIPDLGVIDGTVKLYVELVQGDELWTQIEYLVDADPDDKVFAVYTDDKGNTEILLGDNLNGAIPTYGMQVWATYRIGVGSLGNLPAGAVNAIKDELEHVTIPFLLDGTADSSEMIGGTDPETLEQIRANAPLAFRTQQRAVSERDFKDLALHVPGVLKAHAVAQHYTNVSLYVVGPSGGAPSTKLVESVYDFFEDKTLAGVSLTVTGPTKISVNFGEDTEGKRIELTVKDRYNRTAVTTAVRSAIQNFLSISNVDFAMKITISDVYHAIMAVEGVDYVYVPMVARADASQTGTATMEFRNAELPQPGNIVISATGGIT